jgi:sterol desaturase/sphingolipid hydroxylase (fatty acid hydroxylase superfamily)
MGLTPGAASAVLLATTLLSIFQHSNVRTPRWLGYIVQRPESHSRHHARGVHYGNFSDLPIFDILFGTIHNPRDFAAEAGFYHGASRRVAEMLRFRDVSLPPAAQGAAIDTATVAAAGSGR